MPHATEPLTNGENSSQFISHLASLPVVHNGIETFKSNSYGKKSIEVAENAYTRFGKPVEPYFETPYSYAKPYVQKADQLADSGLSTVEAHFPIVKEEPETIIDTAKSYALWPIDYLTKTWNNEYSQTAKSNGNSGLSTSVLAIYRTELKIASDFFQTLSDFLGPKYEEGRQKGAEYVRQLEDTAGNYKQIGEKKLGELRDFGNEKADQGKQEAKKTKAEAQKKVDELK